MRNNNAATSDAYADWSRTLMTPFLFTLHGVFCFHIRNAMFQMASFFLGPHISKWIHGNLFYSSFIF